MDLDQGGFGFQRVRTYLGPSLGWTDELVQPSSHITAGGDYQVLPGESLLLVDVAATVNILLPDVRGWWQQTANQPATGFDRSITIKDFGNNAGAFHITVTPFDSQVIDTTNTPLVIDTNGSAIKMVPLADLSGWAVALASASGGGGAGGDVFKAGNNTFTGINTFLGATTVPTVPTNDNSQNAATTQWVKSQGYLISASLSGYAQLNSPIFTGDPQAPTPPLGDNDSSIATTAFVKGVLATSYQPLDADLTSIAAQTATGQFFYRIADGSWAPVTIGANMSFASGVLSSTGGGGGGAPTTAEYITSATDATLTNERVLTNTASITWDFSTPGQAKANTSAGGGNVSNAGTPTAGQLASWTTSTTIQGIAVGAGLTITGGALVCTVSTTGLAPLASPVFTGDARAPTPSPGDNDTSIATTAFVTAAIAATAGNSRPLLTANRTYYVRKDGSDTNNGLTDTAGGAFLTIQKGVDTIAGIDRGVFNVTLQIRDGSYPEIVTLKAGVGGTPISVVGHVGSPGSVVINPTGISVIASQLGDTVYNLSYFKVAGSVGGIKVQGSTLLNADNIEFAASGSAQAFATAAGATLNITSPTISGSSVTMFNCENFGSIQCNNTTVTFTIPVSFQYVCFSAVLCTISVAQVTWVGGGNVTGYRYFVQTNAVVYTGGGGETYIPGTINGVFTLGGIYI